MPDLPQDIVLAPPIARALRDGAPVVALESAVISHGLPHPTALEAAAMLEAEVTAGGAVPATVAVVRGRITVGADRDDLAHLTAPGAWKIAERDLPVAVAARATGGTTVAATIAVAARAGITVMSTGGIGGVHLGAEQTWDVSADLPALARHSLIVVCAGAKAICDPHRTLEVLETAGVTVLVYGADRFPHFYARDSGVDAPRRVDDPAQCAAILAAGRRLRRPGAVLLAQPIPREDALPGEVVARAVTQAVAAAGGVRGADLTPALLAALAEITGGATLRANLALLRANAQLSAAVARAAAQESLRG